MKIIFFSDIHGMAETLKKLLYHADNMHADQLVILGDILYHGPRNGVPDVYDPPEVVKLLNARKNSLLAVRGNCDSEVDQMLLEFPIMADYAELISDDQRFFLTHGHLWNENRQPDVPEGTILVHGHTHVPVLKKSQSGLTIFNPGSISLPKSGYPQSFGFYDGKKLTVHRLDDGTIFDLK
ncbi:MAG: phosphodiesterase [Lentisphaeria bacterium]|nr:phosphodiesterase [Lentisphaeria bacterium]